MTSLDGVKKYFLFMFNTNKTLIELENCYRSLLNRITALWRYLKVSGIYTSIFQTP